MAAKNFLTSLKFFAVAAKMLTNLAEFDERWISKIGEVVSKKRLHSHPVS